MCGKQISVSNYSRHIKERHGGTSTLQCRRCSYTTNRTSDLYKHLAVVHHPEDVMDPSVPDESYHFIVPPPPAASHKSAITSGPDEDNKPRSRIPTPMGLDSATTSDGHESSSTTPSRKKKHKHSKKGNKSSTSDVSESSAVSKSTKRKSKRATSESPTDISPEKGSLKLIISKKNKEEGISPPYKKHAITPRVMKTPDVRPKVPRVKSPKKTAAITIIDSDITDEEENKPQRRSPEPVITPRTQLSSGAIYKLPSGFKKISIQDMQPQNSTAIEFSDISSEEYETLSDDITHTSAEDTNIEIKQEMINSYPAPPPATRLYSPRQITNDLPTHTDEEDLMADNVARLTTLEKNISSKSDDKDDSSKPKTKITLSDYQVNRLNNPHTIRVKFQREGLELAVENITGSWRSNLQDVITESVRVYKFVHKHYEKYYNLNIHAEDQISEDKQDPPPAPYEPTPSLYTHPGYGVVNRDNMTAQVELHGATSYLPTEIIEECRRKVLDHQRKDNTPLRDERTIDPKIPL